MHDKILYTSYDALVRIMNKKDSNFFLQRFFVSPSMTAKFTMSVLAQTWCVYTTSDKSAIFNLQRSLFFCWIIEIYANIQRSGYDYRHCCAPKDLEITITNCSYYLSKDGPEPCTIGYQYGDCDKNAWVGTKKKNLWYWSHTVDHRWFHLQHWHGVSAT